MTKPSSVRELIALWPTRKDLAADCSTDDERVSVDRIHKWAQSGTIPAKYHLSVVRAGNRRGFGITAHDLAVLHDTANHSEDAA